jgi:PAS domain S-box-containing protein
MGKKSEKNEATIKTEKYELEEKTLQKIFDILPIGLWFVNKEGKLIKGNPKGIQIWGAEPKVDPSEYGVFKARFYPSGKEIKPKDWSLYKTIKKRETITNELLEIDAFDGKKKIILNHTAPILNKKKELLGAIVLNQDVTEKEKIQKELENTKKFYEETISTLKEGIWVTNKKDEIIFFSKGMEKISDIKTEKAIGLSVTKDFPKETTKEFLTFYERAKKTLKPQYYEAVVVTPTGKKTYQTGWLISKIKNKEYDGMICTIIDETEQHKARIALKKSEELKKSQLEFQKIIANIASKFVKTTMKDFDMTINKMLKELGNTFEVDRSYIFQFDEKLTRMSNTHEWCNQKIKPQIHNLQNIKTSTMPWWMKKISTQKILQITDVNELPRQARKEKKS